MEKHLHIVSLTIPFPVDYGGVYDLFYKLVALHKEGVQIHLHCFEYGGRKQQEELLKFCASVQYYPRTSALSSLFSGLPHIVASRKNEQLINNLLQNDYPIIMDGLQCSYILQDKRFTGRKMILRLYNVEHEYYKDLSQNTKQFFKKLYLNREERLLYKYEQKIAQTETPILAVTQKDVATYQSLFKAKNIQYMPIFLPDNWTVNSVKGRGNYSLYQGDLSVASNEKAALWLIEEVFAGTRNKLIIAGKNPSPNLYKAARKGLNILVIENPSEEQMQDFIKQAHINILPSYSNTGIKLKLLNALYNGRFCLVNNLTTEGSGTEQLCHYFEDSNSCKQKITELMETEFTQAAIDLRKQVLLNAINNQEDAKKLVAALFS